MGKSLGDKAKPEGKLIEKITVDAQLSLCFWNSGDGEQGVRIDIIDKDRKILLRTEVGLVDFANALLWNSSHVPCIATFERKEG